jgi:25S rRNA (uracil2634-N3)-methyltransferase
MAHKRLRGVRKPKLLRVKKRGKDKAERRADALKTDEQKAKEAAAKKAPPPPPRPPGMNKKEARQKATLENMHRNLYATGERILLVGEGNFSFARALCKHLGSGAGVYASSYDSEAVLSKKYSDAAACRKEIEDSLGGTVLTSVDAMRLHKVKEFRGAFRKIVFNFPHLGAGEKDVDKNIAMHRQLLAAFFASAVKCLEPSQDGFIHIALKTGEPYKSWKIVQTARAACPELELKTAVPFSTSAWEGYAHRRTAGFSERYSNSNSEELKDGAKVYVFKRPRPKGDSDSE